MPTGGVSPTGGEPPPALILYTLSWPAKLPGLQSRMGRRGEEWASALVRTAIGALAFDRLVRSCLVSKGAWIRSRLGCECDVNALHVAERGTGKTGGSCI
jgi:hypothetical protein